MSILLLLASSKTKELIQQSFFRFIIFFWFIFWFSYICFSIGIDIGGSDNPFNWFQVFWIVPYVFIIFLPWVCFSSLNNQGFLKGGGILLVVCLIFYWISKNSLDMGESFSRKTINVHIANAVTQKQIEYCDTWRFKITQLQGRCHDAVWESIWDLDSCYKNINHHPVFSTQRCVEKHFTKNTSITICDTLSNYNNKESCRFFYSLYEKDIDRINKKNLWEHCLSLTDSIKMSAECFRQNKEERMQILYNITSCFDVSSQKEHEVTPRQCLEALQIHVEEHGNWLVIFAPAETGLIQIRVNKNIPNKIIYLRYQN